MPGRTMTIIRKSRPRGGGYLDLHVSLSGRGVAQQWLVYAVQGHFSRIVDVATAGGITAYRLPLWHYTTPLVAKARARPAEARRWLLLGTFLYRHPFVAETRLPSAGGLLEN